MNRWLAKAKRAWSTTRKRATRTKRIKALQAKLSTGYMRMLDDRKGTFAWIWLMRNGRRLKNITTLRR